MRPHTNAPLCAKAIGHVRANKAKVAGAREGERLRHAACSMMMSC
jgi:hypothetical protein